MWGAAAALTAVMTQVAVRALRRTAAVTRTKLPPAALPRLQLSSLHQVGWQVEQIVYIALQGLDAAF